jgi:2-phospho-L-lactate guanylyltransferase
MRTTVLIPVKEQSRAKSRLAPILNDKERSALAWAMFEDLVSALQGLSAEVALVTSSACARDRVRPLNWRVIWEECPSGESASVDAASRLLAADGADAVLRLPADIPLAQGEDVDRLLSLPVEPPACVLAPSRDRMGTNALLRTPPDLFPSHFGPDSFTLHLQEASEARAQVYIIENPRLALDLDNASDLQHFLQQHPCGETARLLARFNLEERLADYESRRNSNSRIMRNP